MTETISEIVEREAAEVEAETETETEGDTPETEGETEGDGADVETDDDRDDEPAAPAAPPSDKAAERALASIERAGDTYTRKVQTIQSSTPLGLVECPLCPVPGFVLDVPPPDPDPNQVGVVLAYLGVERPPEYKPSPNYGPCPACDGEGFVATSSKRAGYTDVECADCMGRGYVDRRQEREMQGLHSPEGQIVTPPTGFVLPTINTHPAAASITQGGYEFVPIPGGAPDQFGRLAGHPLWGSPE